MRFLTQLGQEFEVSPVESPVLAVGHPLINANGELVVDHEEALVEQRVNVRPQEKPISNRVAPLVTYAPDVRRLYYVTLPAPSHYTTAVLSHQEFLPEGTLTLSSLDHPQGHLDITIHRNPCSRPPSA